MNTRIFRAGVALALSSLSLGIAKSDPPKKEPVLSGDCPACHMKLSSMKTKDNAVATQLKKGGPIQYCCSVCKMPAGVLVKKPVEKKTAPKKPTKK